MIRNTRNSRNTVRKKKRVVFKKKRTIDPRTVIDYKYPDVLKRFITDRGKIIPRRVSGATSVQQRQISKAVKRARYLALIPYAISHRDEKGYASLLSVGSSSGGGYQQRRFGNNNDSRRPFHDRDRQPAAATNQESEQGE